MSSPHETQIVYRKFHIHGQSSEPPTRHYSLQYFYRKVERDKDFLIIKVE